MDTARLRLRIFLILFALIMCAGVLGFMTAEGLSLSDALYFTIVTIATVGYGDIHPVTQPGKILAVFLIITGVGTFLGVVANVTEMMLARREKKARLEKLNMVIGVFFSELGTRLLADFSRCDPQVEELRKQAIPAQGWSAREYQAALRRVQHHTLDVDAHRVDFEHLRRLLNEKTDGMLRLLENPALLEHESFTGLLQAVFHLREELASRDDVTRLPEADRAHLRGDILRAYRLLVVEWLRYMHHLQTHYPYLFSLAVRTNPFDPDASPVVT